MLTGLVMPRMCHLLQNDANSTVRSLIQPFISTHVLTHAKVLGKVVRCVSCLTRESDELVAEFESHNGGALLAGVLQRCADDTVLTKVCFAMRHLCSRPIIRGLATSHLAMACSSVVAAEAALSAGLLPSVMAYLTSHVAVAADWSPTWESSTALLGQL